MLSAETLLKRRHSCLGPFSEELARVQSGIIRGTVRVREGISLPQTPCPFGVGVPLHQGLHILGDGIFIMRTFLAMGIFLWGRFFYAVLQGWPLISRCACPVDCFVLFYLNERFIFSNDKTNTFVDRISFSHQTTQCLVGNYFPTDASEGWWDPYHWEYQLDVIFVANTPLPQKVPENMAMHTGQDHKVTDSLKKHVETCFIVYLYTFCVSALLVKK